MHRLLALPVACLLLVAAVRAGDPATHAPMIEAVAPAVVTVYTSKAMPQRRMIAPFDEDDPMWRHFFGEPGQRHGLPLPEGRVPRLGGQGSGVVVASDGVILTNNHVIEGADQIEVQLHGAKDRLKATLVGADPKTDIAVLRVEAKGLTPICFADSDQVRVGDLAFAIGNPFGVGQTVSMGIVSAIGRGDVGIVDYEDFIQTDASINPGNSGGALVDSLGRLIGINTAIFSRSGGNVGIGFAVPSSLAKRITDQLVGGGKVVRGYLGVQIRYLTPELARKFKAEPGKGVLVDGVVDDGPAAKAGVKDGDVILRVAATAVGDPRQLRMHVAGIAPGSDVELVVQRDGHEETLKVTVGELPGATVAAGGQDSNGEEGGRIGVVLQDLSVQVRQQSGIPAKVQGALVAQVEDGSRAERAGLRPGMVLTEVERRPVADASAAVQQLRLASGEVLLRVWADGTSRWVVVPE